MHALVMFWKYSLSIPSSSRWLKNDFFIILNLDLQLERDGVLLWGELCYKKVLDPYGDHALVFLNQGERTKRHNVNLYRYFTDAQSSLLVKRVVRLQKTLLKFGRAGYAQESISSNLCCRHRVLASTEAILMYVQKLETEPEELMRCVYQEFFA